MLLLVNDCILLLLYRVDQKMSADRSVYSAHEAQEMLRSTREVCKSVRLAQAEKQQLLQVCCCVQLNWIIYIIYGNNNNNNSVLLRESFTADGRPGG